MENKEKLLEEIKQAEQHLINLKESLNKPDTVEVAADGAILVKSKEGFFVGGNGEVRRFFFPMTDGDLRQFSTYNTRKQAEDEVLRREISCHIRRRACQLNDNHDWRKVYGKGQYSIFIKNNNMPEFGLNYNDTYSYLASYFNRKEHAQTVADELNDKYSPETITRLYYREEK